ncbi:MAG: replicative DNA helicase [Clostridia bacterium]|nr:replicative DNA helicase [Clostridia bacterium]
MADELIKRLPFSAEAEQAVLGSVLIDPEVFKEIVTLIKAEDFYLSDHVAIYEAMQEIFLQQDKPIDVITLLDMLVKNGIYSESDGTRYIRNLVQVVPSASNAMDYAQIVKNKSILRKLIKATEDIAQAAYAEADKVEHILDMAEQKIFEISDVNESKGFTHIKDALVRTYDRLNQLQTNRAEALGTPTQFEGLDEVLVGLGKGDLVLVGARPGMGKTSFCLNIASNVAIKTGKTVCIFSLEMPDEQLVSRMLSSEALVNSYNLRSGNLSEEDWTKISAAASKLSQTNIYIDDTTSITVTGMKAKLRRMKNLGLVVIDYLQLMQSDKHTDNRVLEIGDISRGLKIMAKELAVPVICCAQLSRASESRTDKTPMLSDLRDSGAIEQDADIVMFLYRPEYYDDSKEKANLAQVIIAKNRHGSTGKVDMMWNGEYTKFSTLEKRYGDEQ